MPVVPCPDCSREVSTSATACPHCGRPSPGGLTPPAQAFATPPAEERLWRGSPSWTLLLGRLALTVLALAMIPVLHFLSRGGEVGESTMSVIRVFFWLAAAAFLVGLGWFFVGYLRLKSTVYTLTNQRITIESGLLSKSLNEIDLRYVEDTQFEQGVLERLLGIGRVKIISADKSSPTLVLQSIHDPRGVRETIRTHAYNLSQRQLFTRAT